MGWSVFGGGRKVANLDRATLEAMSKSQAIIEFNLDGTIISANSNFLSLLGYELSEVVGKHHRMFLDPGNANSSEYLAF